MSGVTDEFMRGELRKLKQYTLVIFHEAGEEETPGADKVIWEHGRRGFSLKREGLLDIVCPVEGDSSKVAGIWIFSTNLEKTKEIMQGDPAVKAGILKYELHVVRGFPGDSLSDRT